MLTDRQLDRFDLPFPLGRPVTGQDLLALIPHLIQPAWSAAANALGWRLAHVTAIHTGPASVDLTTLQGEPFPAVRYLDSYTPAVADLVFLLVNAERQLVIGALAA